MNIIYTDNRSGKINEDPRSGRNRVAVPVRQSGLFGIYLLVSGVPGDTAGIDIDDVDGFTMVTRKGNKKKAAESHYKKDAGMLNSKKQDKPGEQEKRKTGKKTS